MSWGGSSYPSGEMESNSYLAGHDCQPPAKSLKLSVTYKVRSISWQFFFSVISLAMLHGHSHVPNSVCSVEFKTSFHIIYLARVHAGSKSLSFAAFCSNYLKNEANFLMRQSTHLQTLLIIFRVHYLRDYKIYSPTSGCIKEIRQICLKMT